MGYALCSALGVKGLEPVGLRRCLRCSQPSERQWEFGHQKSAKSNYTTEAKTEGQLLSPSWLKAVEAVGAGALPWPVFI